MDRKKNLQYFRQQLRDHLRESFPQLAEDTRLINQRARWAVNAYEGALSAGNPENQCLQIANHILFEGFHFSKFDTLLDVLCHEFSHVLPEGELRPMAQKIFPLCEQVFAKYELSDDFAYNLEHDLLYRELKELINIKFKEYGLQ